VPTNRDPEWTVTYAVQLGWTAITALAAGVYLVGRWPPRNLALGYVLLVWSGFVLIKLADLWRARRSEPEPASFLDRPER
jgi:hypothetical protein